MRKIIENIKRLVLFIVTINVDRSEMKGYKQITHTFFTKKNTTNNIEHKHYMCEVREKGIHLTFNYTLIDKKMYGI